MTELTGFAARASDWRRQLEVNDRRTRIVIVCFIIIYLFVGLLIDIYLHPELDQLTIIQEIIALATFQVIPIATLIMGAVATISILVTFSLHDRIILLGTEYYEVTPKTARNAEEQQLYNVIEELKIAAGLRFMPKIFIIEANYMNAFASGYSEKSALVAITQGLMQKLSRSELQAVMAHELSHIRHHDIKLTLMATVLSNIALIAIDLLFKGIIFGGGRRRRSGRDGGGNALFLIIMLVRFALPLLTIVLMMYLSRTREFMADAGSVELTRDNAPLANALLKISSDHKENQDIYADEYNNTEHEDIRRAAYIFEPSEAGIPLKQSMFSALSTHPSIKDRLKALGFTKK